MARMAWLKREMVSVPEKDRTTAVASAARCWIEQMLLSSSSGTVVKQVLPRVNDEQ